MVKQDTNENFRYIVRVGGTDIDGKKQLAYSLTKIKGVGYSFANAVCMAAGLDKTKKAGELSDTEIEKLNQILASPLEHGIPNWMVNRKKDYETGEDKHLLTGDLAFVKSNDIKRLRKIKAYRGFRHARGLPVRGQRTKSNFRKNKGKTLGVKKKK